MKKNTRLFVGVDIPSDVKDQVIAIQDDLRKSGLIEGTWVIPKNLHLTLCFIGTVKEPDVTIIQQHLQEIHATPFSVTINVLSMQRNKKAIIWLDVNGTMLAELSLKIMHALKDFVKQEQRIYQGHVTLVRVKKIFDEEKLTTFLKDYRVTPFSFVLDRFQLKKSEKTADGSQYTTVSEYYLK